jgi:hypothetical protein
MTAPSWDEYVAGDDLGVTASESDVAYAGIDAAAASAVGTDIVDAVAADASPDEVAADTGTDAVAGAPQEAAESVQAAVDSAATAQDWADWNTETADEWAASVDSYVQYAETNAAADHEAAAADETSSVDTSE